jgi:CheY-like chemotaxis protein
MKILITDDQPDLRDTLKMLLELRGHSVDVAVNGEDAVSMAVQSPPDVILMDLHMPVMDGITATRLLRARPETQTVPIIGVSGFLGQERWERDAFDAGCTECLPKPLELKKFEELLERLRITPGGPEPE